MIRFKQFLQETTNARKATKEQNNHKNLLIRLAAVQAGGGSGIYGDTEETLKNKIKLAQHGIDLYGGANKTQDTLMLRDDGHYDVHKLTPEHLDWLGQQPEVLAANGPVTLTLPEYLPELPNAIIGPVMGDAPVHDNHSDVYFESRGGGRNYDSKMLPGKHRTTRMITAIVRPHKETGRPLLITAFGGPLAPKEPNDSTLRDEERQQSEEFWSKHALLDGEESIERTK